MIPKFNPENMSVELVAPTIVENDAQLQDYYAYIKSVGTDIGSLTEEDIKPFYFLMKIPQRFSKDALNKLFGLLNQMAGAERFADVATAKECVSMIDMYRTEMDM